MNPVKALSSPARLAKEPGKSSWRWSLLGPVMACLSLAACGPAEEQGPWPEQSLTEQRAEVTSAPAEPLSADLSTDIARVLVDKQPVVMGDADFFDNQDTNLMVQQNNTEVFITFVSSTAQNNNTLLYFTYPDGQVPTLAPTLSQSNVVFGSLSGLVSGTTVKLGSFNAGTRIGYAVVANGGASTPPDLGKPKVYSVAGLNSDKVQVISKYHKAEKRRVIGVEDTDVAIADKDYNDAVFLIRSSPPEVVETNKEFPGVPIAELTARHSGCTAAELDGTTGVTRNCYSAAEFWCVSKGMEFTGANLTHWDTNTDLATLQCFRSKYFVQVPIADITALAPGCSWTTLFANGSTEYTKECQLGAYKYCNNQGYSTGLIQQSQNSRFGIACYERSVGQNSFRVANSSWLETTAGGCTSATYNVGKDYTRACRRAASNYCKTARSSTGGILSGYDVAASEARITCF